MQSMWWSLSLPLDLLTLTAVIKKDVVQGKVAVISNASRHAKLKAKRFSDGSKWHRVGQPTVNIVRHTDTTKRHFQCDDYTIHRALTHGRESDPDCQKRREEQRNRVP